MEKSEKSQYEAAPDYSTLEVAVSAPAPGGYAATTPPPAPPMAAQSTFNHYLQPQPQPPIFGDQQPVSPQSPSQTGYYVQDADKGYGSPIVPWSNYQQPVYPAYGPGPMSPPPPLPPQSSFGPPTIRGERRIAGMKRRTFWLIMIAVALILIGVIVGGAVGATVGRGGNGSDADADASKGGSSSSPSSPPPSSTAAGPSSDSDPDKSSDSSAVSPGGNSKEEVAVILQQSKLSAVNWTDANSNDYRAVFWQDSSTALMMSIWDSTSKSWDVVNITDKAGSNVPAAKVGTPLAATVRSNPYTDKYHPFLIALFYLGPQSTVEVVTSPRLSGSEWKVGSLSTRDSKYKAGDGSSLTVLFDLCAGSSCSGNMRVFYQSPEKSLVMLDSSDWSHPPEEVDKEFSNGGLAVTQVASKKASDGKQADNVQLYCQKQADVKEMYRNPKATSFTQGKMKPPISSTKIMSGLDSGKQSDLAVTTWLGKNDETGPRRKVLVAMAPDGSLIATHWNNQKWAGASMPNLTGGGDDAKNRFTSVSLMGGSDTVRFYGRTERGIAAYKVDVEDPFKWEFEEIVRVEKAA